MASSKKPTYKVETKLTTERKRRKSDLVLMWQSMMDVTVIIVRELWTTIIRLWEFLQIWFSSSERFLVQTWLEKYLPYVPEDFSESWRDGRLLGILLNKLQPGCFPDAYHLDPDYGLKNVYRVFDALEIYFKIKPNVSAEEIVTCSDGSDSKLFTILLELKNLTDAQPENKETEQELLENIKSPVEDTSCIVKGTGLAVGFVEKASNFIIFCATISDLDVVVEIRGPNSICSERITKRSPRRKRSGLSFDCSRQLIRSASLSEEDDCLNAEENSYFKKRIIPLEYEIVGNQISLSYKPREKGKHKVTILCRGKHVSDSPYIVNVEDSLDVVGTKSSTPLKSAFKSTSVTEKHESRKISFQIQESQDKCAKPEQKNKCKEIKAGRVISRKLIRYIVRINGKDIPVNADSTQSLATELLKMDYDFETCPSFHRRNSWGFAGDAERKKSVIRQFCIDVKELDAQISQRRTRSLSMNPGPKKLLERSDSFDSLTSKLHSLSEDVFENNEKSFENEDDYAYINEDINPPGEVSEIKIDSFTVTAHDTYLEKNTNIFLSELTGSKFDKSLEERSSDATEADKISLLSTNEFRLEKVDRSEDDLHQKISPYSSPAKCKLIGVDKEDNMSMTYQCIDKNLFNSSSELNNNIKNKNIPSKSKIFRKNPKMNMYQKKKNKNLHKHHIMKGKNTKLTVKTFYRKISKNKSSIFLPSVIIYRKRGVNIRCTFKIEKRTLSKSFKNIQINSIEESINPNFKYEKVSEIFSKDFSNESLNIASNFTSQIKDYKNDNDAVKWVENKELETNAEVFSFYQIMPQHLIKKEEHSSKDTVEEPKAKKNRIKQVLNSTPISSIFSAVKTKDENAILNRQLAPMLKHSREITLNNSYKGVPTSLTVPEKNTKPVISRMPKALRIHTLKTLGQFNFKQFNPPFDSESIISPVRSQIEHWENTLSPERECISLKKLHEASDTEQVSVKEKLAFWEFRTKESSQISSPENNRKANLIASKKSFPAISDPFRNDDLHKHNCSGHNSCIPEATTKNKLYTFIDKEASAATEKETEDKTPPAFQIDAGKIRSLSFSDPVVSEETLNKAENSASFPSSELSRTEYSDTTSDGDLEEYDSDDDSGGDYILHSTEDEYIDDEISERASEYWGDLSIVKNWVAPQCPANENSSWDDKFLQNYNQRDKSYPDECKVFGVAVYYGYVAVKNRFQVFTGDAGFGNLSVSMQGIRRHEVSLVSVTYMRNEIYEVTYQVMTAGYYLISIRWMDRDIPGSPFVCKVTF